jgi:hypothetical protein
VFWDWKTGKIASRLRAHKEVVIDHAWLPNEHVSFECRLIIGLELMMFSRRWSLLPGTVRSSCGHSSKRTCIAQCLGYGCLSQSNELSLVAGWRVRRLSGLTLQDGSKS